MRDSHNDFVSNYLRLCNLDGSEAPAVYHRWVCLSIMGAFVGRRVWFNFGIGDIYLNQYLMLMGSPGTRKGSAMGIGRKLLKATGYNRFAPDKCSKEQFIKEMKQFDLASTDADDLELIVMDEPSEVYIMAGEFTDFIGQGNMDFVTLLTNLWDNLEQYKHPKITGKSVEVHEPTVNMLGANTPDGFSLAFPPEALGNGFLSRVILLHAEPTTTRIPWPDPIDPLQIEMLAKHMLEVKEQIKGEIVITEEAKKLGSKIYKEEIAVDDARFVHYQQRRFIHLLKIASLLAVFDKRKLVTAQDIRRANTMLASAERDMPKALGEFGSSKHSSVAGKIMAHLNSVHLPQSPIQLWKVVSRDLGKMSDLVEILQNLKSAEKVQVARVAGKDGYLPKHAEKKEWPEDTLDLDWLTSKEFV